MNEAAIFAEGIISTRDHESGAVFTPDGKTVYFVKSTPDLSFRTIVFSRFDGTRWGTPEVAPFSGQFSDSDPFISPDGTKLYFSSTRPANGATPKRDFDIWLVEKTGEAWGEPRNLGASVNTDSNETSPCVTGGGALYFSSNRPGGKGAADIYLTRITDGKYGAAENLGDAINEQGPELQVYVAPDESFIIVTAGRAGGFGGADLYSTYKEKGAWLQSANLGEKVNSSGSDSSPRVSPDGRYLFFTSTRGFGFEDTGKRLTYEGLVDRLRSPRNSMGDIYQIDLSALKLKE